MEIGIRDRNNVDVAAESSVEAIKEALIKQLYSPVRWTETIQYLAQQGIDVSYRHTRAHETVLDLICRLPLVKKTLITVSHSHTPPHVPDLTILSRPLHATHSADHITY